MAEPDGTFATGFTDIVAPEDDVEVNDDPEYQMIHTAIRTGAWRKIKFISSQKQKETLAMLVCNIVAHQNESRTGLAPNVTNAENRLAWRTENQVKVSQALCRVRQYVNNNVKLVVDRCLEANDGHIPHPNIIKDIVFRTYDITEKADELPTAIWWYHKICPQLTANSDHWREDKYFYQTLSNVIHSYMGHPLEDLTIEHEVYGLLLYENNWQRWIQMHQHRRKNPGKSVIIFKNNKLPSGQMRKEKPKEKHVYYEDEPLLVPVHSRPDSGRGDFNGWSSKGLKRYVDLLEGCRAARDEKDEKYIYEWELKLLVTLRQQHGITGATLEEQRELDGRRVAKRVAPEIEGVFDASELAYLSTPGTHDEAQLNELNDELGKVTTFLTNHEAARREAEKKREIRRKQAKEKAKLRSMEKATEYRVAKEAKMQEDLEAIEADKEDIAQQKKALSLEWKRLQSERDAFDSEFKVVDGGLNPLSSSNSEENDSTSTDISGTLGDKRGSSKDDDADAPPKKQKTGSDKA